MLYNIGDKVDGITIRCPVCEPLSYYGGKSGLDEKESQDMCDTCFKELANLFAYMATETGDSAYITDKSPIIPREHRRIIRAYLAGSGLPYIVCKEPVGNWKIEKLCGIPLDQFTADLEVLKDEI